MTMAWSWVRVSCLALLFSGCLAAAVNKDIPEAAAALQIYPSSSPILLEFLSKPPSPLRHQLKLSYQVTPSQVTLTKFAFKEAKETGERLPETKYASLDVCFTKELEIADDEIFTLLYTIADGSQMTEYNGAAPAEEAGGAVCVTFASADGTAIVMPPPDKAITYNLHIASQTEGTEQMGEATFTLDPTKYITGDVIGCGEASYTRETVASSEDCEAPEGQLINGNTCYRVAGGNETDAEVCMLANPEADPDDQLKVCLSDKPSTVATIDGTASVASLSYTGGDITTGASLEIEYKYGTAPSTKLEMIMQDIDGQTLFYASACPDGELSCDIDGYTQGAKTYQVCAINADDPAAITSTNPGEITDLNLAAIQYGEKLEFGFNNARPADGMYYSATVDDGSGSRTAVPVGINCNGVLAHYTCYGFLDISGLPDGDLLLTVEYGELTAGDVTPAGLNKIIGTYTKMAP